MNQRDANGNRLLTGNLFRVTLALATPMFISAVLQNAQNLIDLFWVGRLGPESVAALTLSGTIMMAAFPITVGLATGTIALVSRAFGAGDARGASHIAAQSLSVALLVGLAIGLGMLPWLDPGARLLGADEKVAALAVEYLRISMLGFFTINLLFVGNSALHGAGNTIGPMVAMLSANLINLALDPLMIFGWGPIPGYGVSGAAAATFCSNLIACGIVLVQLSGGITRLHLLPRDFKPSMRTGVRLLRIGLPSIGQMASRSLTNLVFFGIVAHYGTAVVAGYGIGLRFHMVLLMPCFVLGNAAATLVGQNLGAGQPDRSRRAAWTSVGMVISAVVVSAAMIQLWATPIVGLFTGDPEVLSVGVGYLKTVTPFYLFAGLSIVLNRSLAGAGDTVPPFFINLVSLWGMQVPVAYLLADVLDYPVQTVWWSICLAMLVNALLSTIWFERGGWRNKRV